MHRAIIGALLAGLLAFPGGAVAQDWPTRPVTMVVPFAAGGPIDVVARIITPRMSELLGQQLVVANIPGAGGLVVSNTKVLVVRKDLPVNTLAEFVAYAKANQAKMSYGSAGGGSATHIA